MESWAREAVMGSTFKGDVSETGLSPWRKVRSGAQSRQRRVSHGTFCGVEVEMSEILRFLWVSFRAYWMAWVTGTGGMGFLLWALNYYSDKIRRKPMSLRTNLMILFCAFWFIGTFSAWHDSEKNLTSVIKQRAEDNSHLGQCQSDLRVTQVQLDGWRQISEGRQAQLNEYQRTFSSSLASINACVMSLAKESAPSQRKITLYPFIAYVNPRDSTRLIVFIARTNMPIRPVKAHLKCQSDIRIQKAEILAEPFTMGGAGNVSPTEIEIDEEAGEWTQDRPLLISIASKNDLDPTTCQITLQ